MSYDAIVLNGTYIPRSAVQTARRTDDELKITKADEDASFTGDDARILWAWLTAEPPETPAIRELHARIEILNERTKRHEAALRAQASQIDELRQMLSEAAGAVAYLSNQIQQLDDPSGTETDGAAPPPTILLPRGH